MSSAVTQQKMTRNSSTPIHLKLLRIAMATCGGLGGIFERYAHLQPESPAVLDLEGQWSYQDSEKISTGEIITTWGFAWGSLLPILEGSLFIPHQCSRTTMNPCVPFVGFDTQVQPTSVL